jgi:PAS domain S-box-containing protein
MQFNRHSGVSSLSPARIALGYAAISILWIAFSDAVVTRLRLSPDLMTIKGAVFVFVTAVLLYFTIRRLAEALALRSFALNNANDVIVFINEQGRILDINEQGCRTLGYTREELLAIRVSDIDPDFRENGWADHWRTLREQGSLNLESRHRTKEGRWFPVEISAKYLEYGGRTFNLAVVRDITERKRAEEERRESAERFRAIADYTYDWENWIGVDGRLLWVNPAVERMTGYSVSECMAIPDFPLPIVAESDRDMFAREMREAIKGSSRNDFEFQVRHKEGRLVWVAASWQPIYDSRGVRLGYRSSIRDIAERKRAEEALRASESRFRLFVDHAGDALFIQDIRGGTIVDVNRQACQSLGYTREELIGKTPSAFRFDSDRADLESIADRVALGETVIDTHWHRRKDGSQFPVEVHTTSFFHGGRSFLLKVARDISDRVRAEAQREKLRQLEADLTHLNRVSMMGELTASIAHEVNQPLVGVVSNASACLRWLAAEAPNLDEARESARRIVRDGKRAAEVIARTRAMTKKATVATEELDLNVIIRQVLALVGDQAKRNNVMIRTQFANELFPVPGDRVQLQQVVMNLVMNGMESMSSIADRARELVIATRNVHGDQVQVSVEDSGAGVDPDAIPKIFDPFYTTKPGGMGMGLSISNSIIKSHGGRLWAVAKDGPGTVFHFTLPKRHEEGANAGFARR